MSDHPFEPLPVPVPANAPPAISAAEAMEYRAHIVRIGPTSGVRQAAEALLAGQTDIDPSPFFTGLAMPRSAKRERLISAWALGHLPLDEATRDAAIDMLRKAVRQRGKRRRGNAAVRATITATAIAAGLLASFLWIFAGAGGLVSHTWAFLSVLVVLILLVSSITIPIYLIGDLMGRDDDTRSAAITSLGMMHALQATGDLSNGLFDVSQRVRVASARALHEMLPLLGEEQYGTLSEEDTASLTRALTVADNLLVIKVLEALAKVGTPRAIAEVERYAKAAPTPGLRESAERTLTALRARQAMGEQARTLMRPAASPGDQALLRPAQGAGETPAEQLLRPSEGER